MHSEFIKENEMKSKIVHVYIGNDKAVIITRMPLKMRYYSHPTYSSFSRLVDLTYNDAEYDTHLTESMSALIIPTYSRKEYPMYWNALSTIGVFK